MDYKKFPKALSTKTKRIEKARKLVEDHLQLKTVAGKLAGFQGMWSETYIITTEDDSKAVIQFRAEPLDIAPFQRARKLIGSYCPTVQLLHDEDLAHAGFYPVYLSYIEGHTWCDDPRQDDAQLGPDLNVTVMKSLARLLARCVVDETNKSAVVQSEVLDKLDKRLASKRSEIDPFRATIQALKHEVQTRRLDKLPLFQSHMDLNDMNIMITGDGKVTGIIDWELSPMPQPFGMGLHRIHSLAAICRQGIYQERAEFHEMEHGFWDELLNSLPRKHRDPVMENLEAVQLALTVGTVLWCFDFDNGGEYVNPALLAALPRFLRYRIPALRGNGSAYGDP